jgi:hypothetical protein
VTKKKNFGAMAIISQNTPWLLIPAPPSMATDSYWPSPAVWVKIMIEAIRPVEMHRPLLQGEEDAQDRELLADFRA